MIPAGLNNLPNPSKVFYDFLLQQYLPGAAKLFAGICLLTFLPSHSTLHSLNIFVNPFHFISNISLHQVFQFRPTVLLMHFPSHKSVERFFYCSEYRHLPVYQIFSGSPKNIQVIILHLESNTKVFTKLVQVMLIPFPGTA